jgi:hypothetical protein
MRTTTKIELTLRLIGVLGVLLLLYGVWIRSAGFLSNATAYLGLIILFLAIASAFGIGPIGRRLRGLYTEENKKSREKYKCPPQPWDT